MEEVPVHGVKLFTCPTVQNHCILVRSAEDTYVAYSQKGTHSLVRCITLPSATNWSARATSACFRRKMDQSWRDRPEGRCRACCWNAVAMP